MNPAGEMRMFKSVPCACASSCPTRPCDKTTVHCSVIDSSAHVRGDMSLNKIQGRTASNIFGKLLVLCLLSVRDTS